MNRTAGQDCRVCAGSQCVIEVTYTN